MTRAYWIALIAGLVFAPWAIAQPASGPSRDGQASAGAEATIPPDQQASKEQLTRLFEVMRLREQFDSLMKMLPNMVEQQVHAQLEEMTSKLPNAHQLAPEQQAALDKLMSKYMEKARTIYPVDDMIADAIAVYQRHMSGPDVEAYIAFFSSPPGQRFLDAQPAIMKEYMPVAFERARERGRELNAEMAADLEQFVKDQSTPAK